jgi:hypothetical protein
LPVNETNRRTEIQFYWYYDSTCFGQPFCPSSGVLSRTSALVHFCRFDDRLLPEAGWRVVIPIKIGIQCVCWFHSLGICHDARSCDLKRAVRRFVIHFRYQETSHTKDTTTAVSYSCNFISWKPGYGRQHSGSLRAERGVVTPMWARFHVLIHIGLPHNGYQE